MCFHLLRWLARVNTDESPSCCLSPRVCFWQQLCRLLVPEIGEYPTPLGKHCCWCELSQWGPNGRTRESGEDGSRESTCRQRQVKRFVCLCGCTRVEEEAVWALRRGKDWSWKRGKRGRVGEWRERDMATHVIGGTIWWLIGSEIGRQLAKVRAASDGVLLISGSMCWCMCNPCWQTKQAFLLKCWKQSKELWDDSQEPTEPGDKSTSILSDPPSVCNPQACTSTGEATCGWLDVCPYYSRDWRVETIAVSAR